MPSQDAPALPPEIRENPRLFGAHLLRAVIQEDVFQPIWYVQPRDVPHTACTLLSFMHDTRERIEGWLQRHPGMVRKQYTVRRLLGHLSFLATMYGIPRLLDQIPEEDAIAGIREHVRCVRDGTYWSMHPLDPATSKMMAVDDPLGGTKQIAVPHNVAPDERKMAEKLMGTTQPNIRSATGPVADLLRSSCAHLLRPHPMAVTLHLQDVRLRLLGILKDVATMDEGKKDACLDLLIEEWHRMTSNSFETLVAIQQQAQSGVDPTHADFPQVRAAYLDPLFSQDKDAFLARLPLFDYTAFRLALERKSENLIEVARLFDGLATKHHVARCDIPSSCVALLGAQIMLDDDPQSLRDLLIQTGWKEGEEQ